MADLMKLYRHTSGYWYVRRPDGKRKSLKTRNADEASRIYKAMQRAVLHGKLAEIDSERRATIAEIQTEFFLERSDLAMDTVSAYQLAFRLLIDMLGSSTLITRVTTRRLAEFKQLCRVRGVADVSINTYLRHIRSILNFAYTHKYLKDKVQVPMISIGMQHPRILTREEIDLLLCHAAHCRPVMAPIILFALWTGCRRHEIWSLTWERVKDGYCTVLGKGRRERTVPLLPGAVDAMGLRRDIGPVFWHPTDIDRYSKEFKKLARDCELEDVSFHKLRHTAACNMLASGVELRYVQEMLGHAQVSTTQIYVQVVRDKLKEQLTEKFTKFVI